MTRGVVENTDKLRCRCPRDFAWRKCRKQGLEVVFYISILDPEI